MLTQELLTEPKNSLNKGLKVAFSSGTVMGLTVVGLGLFGHKRLVHNFKSRSE